MGLAVTPFITTSQDVVVETPLVRQNSLFLDPFNP